jgi:hypothetical protein
MGKKTSQQLSIFIFISFETTENKGCVTPCGLAIYTLKFLKAKLNMETQIFHHAKI